MFKQVLIASTLVLPLAFAAPTVSQAVAFNTKGAAAFSSSGASQPRTVAFSDRKTYFSGREKLKRLLRPHSRRGNIITQDVRDATGDPNIVVFDQRGGGGGDVYRCSYLTYHGKRALQCD